MRHLTTLALFSALSATASAQITTHTGEISNPIATLDFDNPLVASGPIASNDPVFTNAGIANVSVVGAWIVAGDLMTNGSNVMGQALIVNNGQLSIAGPGETLDNAGVDDGFDVTLVNPADEFQITFVDQIGMPYDVELFSGATSLGIGNFQYHNSFPAPPIFFRAGVPFDRIVLTFPGQGANGTGGLGLDNIKFGDGPPPPPLPANCVETTYINNNGGGVGGMVYFDLTTTGTVVIEGLAINTPQQGTPVGLQVYTIPTTYIGNESNMAAWTLVAEDDGTTIALGVGFRTQITFVNPITLPAGTVGVALVGMNPTTGATAQHAYTTGNGMNQMASSANGVLSISAGAASNGTFVGGVFSPRVFNGTICTMGDPLIGTNYCGPGVPNSTGASGEISAMGSDAPLMNNLTLMGSSLPTGSFGFFLTSQAQGFVMNPGGSQGNLCLGGSIGRYVGPGQIQNSGAAGEISLVLDLTMTPTPTGLVSVQAGETWNFTAWHRDAVGGMATSNFTDGLEVLFQ